MTSAHELRIGNHFTTYISKFRSETLTALAIQEGYVGYDKFGKNDFIWLRCEDIKPIRLTPEILEKCGYKKEEECWLNEKTDGDINDINSVTGGTLYIYQSANSFQFNVCSDTYNGYDVEVKYLHQLQNLYFALTNQELKITL